VQNNNASLAIQLATSWLAKYKGCSSNCSNVSATATHEIDPNAQNATNNNNEYILTNNNNRTGSQSLCFKKVADALESCRWPGRTQFLPEDTMDFYIDGAHTTESIEICASWFRDLAISKRLGLPSLYSTI
jgi:folylpolyglutamate synthase/dihydropteroate synthase